MTSEDIKHQLNNILNPVPNKPGGFCGC